MGDDWGLTGRPTGKRTPRPKNIRYSGGAKPPKKSSGSASMAVTAFAVALVAIPLTLLASIVAYLVVAA